MLRLEQRNRPWPHRGSAFLIALHGSQIRRDLDLPASTAGGAQPQSPHPLQPLLLARPEGLSFLQNPAFGHAQQDRVNRLAAKSRAGANSAVSRGSRSASNRRVVAVLQLGENDFLESGAAPALAERPQDPKWAYPGRWAYPRNLGRLRGLGRRRNTAASSLGADEPLYGARERGRGLGARVGGNDFVEFAIFCSSLFGNGDDDGSPFCPHRRARRS
jgi:hypothetical protein